MRKRTFAMLVIALCAGVAHAQDPEPIHITKADTPITIDGDLSDAAWKNAARVEKWYEINVSDNAEPSVKSVGYLTYDAKYLYAGFEFFDPDPSQIRGPYNDRDHISGNTDDFCGILLDTRNDKRSGVEMFVTARGTQYDAVTDDFSGEDSSPDFFWDAATKITKTGWTAEMRIPFSSLRYDNPNPREWGIMLYRNYPRDRRYQIFSNRLPRGSNCFVCHRAPLVGLQGLPSGGHLVTAPYVTAR
ncbi:MAG TPA: carbohydrate binding family 9 domain-containing protein, partial [Thermoanaerobaculia bacterium]|nr:carbohydrate binding family 9 domain-containing protein [Thermoanaerobaculia bacterium]